MCAPASRGGGASRRPVRVAILAISLALTAGGCGVSLQEEAESLPAGAIPSLSPSPSATTPTETVTTVYFVTGPSLTGVKQPVEQRTPEAVMDALAVGPPAGEGEGLRTLILDPLTREPMLAVTSVSPDKQVGVITTPAYFQTPALDQILLIGQVVLSMDEIGMPSVLFFDPAGNPMAPPLPNGLVREGATTAADYEILLAPPEGDDN